MERIATSYLFVYGTLMETINSDIAKFLRANSRYVGLGKMNGRLYDLGHYPGAIYDRSEQGFVTGNVFELFIPAEVFPVLDHYEGIGDIFEQPQEYIRKVVPISIGQMKQNCWAYLYNLSTVQLKAIPLGNYKDYLEANEKHLKFIDAL